MVVFLSAAHGSMKYSLHRQLLLAVSSLPYRVKGVLPIGYVRRNIPGEHRANLRRVDVGEEPLKHSYSSRNINYASMYDVAELIKSYSNKFAPRFR